MNAKEAADAARSHITSENRNLVNVQLDLEEVVPDPARRDWRVILSFTPPGGQQGQQGASTSRDYKKVIISDTNGALVSMKGCTPYTPKSASARRSRSFPRTLGGWWYGGPLWPTLVSSIGITLTLTTAFLVILQPMFKISTIAIITSFAMPWALSVAVTVVLVIVGSRHLRATSNKRRGSGSGKCCRRKPAGS